MSIIGDPVHRALEISLVDAGKNNPAEGVLSQPL